MNFKRLALSCSTVLAFGGMLQASTVYNYAFGGLGDLNSNTHTFAPVSGSAPTITATGFSGLGSSAKSVNLYSKGTSAFPIKNDESGLGLDNDTSGDHEITSGSAIMLDLSNIDKFSLSSLGLYTESTTDGEKWAIWGSNSAPTLNHSFSMPTSGVITGSSEGDQNISSLDGDRYLYITATCGNILLGGVTATDPTPEPASAGMLGVALLGSGLVFRKRFKKTA